MALRAGCVVGTASGSAAVADPGAALEIDGGRWVSVAVGVVLGCGEAACECFGGFAGVEFDAELGVEVCDRLGHGAPSVGGAAERGTGIAPAAPALAGATMEGGRGAGLGLGGGWLWERGVFCGGGAAAVGEELDLADDAVA